jgi:mono/diheme cytochrome c family protein
LDAKTHRIAPAGAAKAALAALAAALWLGCVPAEKSPRGFRLPDGDAVAGRATFLELECHACHSLAGEQLPAPAEVGEVQVVLGGATTEVKSYGTLVTSIINPSHRVAPGYLKRDTFRDGESLMTVYNETMTVQQLIDLVAFLQPLYKLIPPDLESPMP